MGEYISNKIRCKKCKYFTRLNKNAGICRHPSIHFPFFVRPHLQFAFCFEEGGNK